MVPSCKVAYYTRIYAAYAYDNLIFSYGGGR